MKPIKRRVVHNQPYYKAQQIIRDPRFIERINWLRKRFRDVGCPVPLEGFATNEEYEAWREVYWNRYSEMSKSDEYKEKQLAISGGKELLNSEEFYALEDLRDNYLPPMYGAIFREILEHYKIDPKDQQFKYFLVFYVFRGRRELPQTNFCVRLSRHPKTNELELLIKVRGFTKKEDIVDNWDFITQDQKHLTDYLGKSKKWVEFERDLEIYNLYKQLHRAGKRNNKDPYDKVIMSKMREKYDWLELSLIRKIVERTARRLGEKLDS